MPRMRKRWCIVDQLEPPVGDDLFGVGSTFTPKVLFWCVTSLSGDWGYNPEYAMRWWTKGEAEKYLILVLARSFESRVKSTVKTLKIPDRYL